MRREPVLERIDVHEHALAAARIRRHLHRLADLADVREAVSAAVAAHVVADARDGLEVGLVERLPDRLHVALAVADEAREQLGGRRRADGGPSWVLTAPPRLRPGGGRRLGLPVLAVQRAAVHAEDLRREGLVSPRRHHHAADVAALDLVAGARAPRSRRRASRRRSRSRRRPRARDRAGLPPSAASSA